MIAEGFVLDLYCDNADAHRHEARQRAHEQFFGETKGQCMRAAKQAGWKIGRRFRRVRGSDYCPRCSGKQPPQGGSSDG